MIETDINSLETKKTNLEIKLNELLKNNADKDDINELKSEILYIKKQINQKLRTKEVESQEQIKRKKLTLDNSKRRLLNGQENANPQSRFINEISEEYLDKEELLKKEMFGSKKIFKSSNINKYEEYKPGEKVKHDKYGEGVIISVETSILTIAFAHPHGIVKIMKGHKSIKKI